MSSSYAVVTSLRQLGDRLAC